MLSVTHEQTNQQTEHPVISETSFESADNDLHAATACRVGLMCVVPSRIVCAFLRTDFTYKG